MNSLMVSINEFIDGHPSMIFIDGPSMNSLMDTINEFIDGYPSMNMVPFLWALLWAPSLGPFLWAPSGGKSWKVPSIWTDG